MDYTFRVRLSHVQVTSLTTLVQLLSGTPQHVVCFRLAFDGKVEDLPLEPDLITGDMTSSRGIRFVYRIHAESVEELAETLSRRYATCQVLLKSRPPQRAADDARSQTPQPQALPVVAVLASATASLQELIRAPDPHFLFTLTELPPDHDSDDDRADAGSDHAGDPYFIDSTDASVYKEDDATENSRVGGILGRKDGLVSLQLVVEEMRVVDLTFREDVHVNALPALTSAQLAYRVRDVTSTLPAENLDVSGGADCRAKGYTLSHTVVTSADGEVTFTTAQLPRPAPLKLTPHNLPHHELEVCVLVGGVVYTSMHLPLAKRARPSSSSPSPSPVASVSPRSVVALPLEWSSVSEWDSSGATLHGALTLGNVPCFLEQLTQCVTAAGAEESHSEEGNPATQAKRESGSSHSGSTSTVAIAPGAIALGHVREQVLRPASRASGAGSMASSLSITGPSAPPNDDPKVNDDDSNNTNKLAEPRKPPLMPPPPREDQGGATPLVRRKQVDTPSVLGDASPPQPTRTTMIQHSDDSPLSDGKPLLAPPRETAGAGSDEDDAEVARAVRLTPSGLAPPPQAAAADSEVEERRLSTPNESNIDADTHELTSLRDEDRASHSHSGGPGTPRRLSVGSRRTSVTAAQSEHPLSVSSAEPERKEAPASASPQRQPSLSARQASTNSRTSAATPTVSEELVLHFGDDDSAAADSSTSGARASSKRRSPSSGPLSAAVPPHPVSSSPPQPQHATTTPQEMAEEQAPIPLSDRLSPSPARQSTHTPLLPPWHPGAEPQPPVPRLAVTARPPPKFAVNFAKTHTKLLGLGHEFRTLLAACETQQRRAEEAEQALTAHEKQHDIDDALGNDGVDTLHAQERQLAAEIEKKKGEISETERCLRNAREESSCDTADDRAAQLTGDEAERLAVYAEVEAGLQSLLQRAERHRHELHVARDRQSLRQLADAQATLEADTASLSRLALSPSPPTSAAPPVRRRDSLAPNASDLVTLEEEDEADPANAVNDSGDDDDDDAGRAATADVSPPVVVVAGTPAQDESHHDDSNDTTTAATGVAPQLPSTPPRPQEGRRPSPRDAPQMTASTPLVPARGAARHSPPLTHTPSPPSNKPPENISPRSRSPLYEEEDGEAVLRHHHSAQDAPALTSSIVLGFSQPCTPEAERRARQDWERRDNAHEPERQGGKAVTATALTSTAAASHSEPSVTGEDSRTHPYAVITGSPHARTHGVATTGVDTSPTLRYGAGSILLHVPQRREVAESSVASTASVRGRSLLMSPATQLFPRLRSSSVDAATLAQRAASSPAPRAPGQRNATTDSPSLSRPPPMRALQRAPIAAWTAQASTTPDRQERFFDDLIHTPHRSAVTASSRPSSVTRGHTPHGERSPSHPYSVPRDYDGAHHYPLVSAGDGAVTARELQVRALMQAIIDGDVPTFVHLVTHTHNVLQGSDNYLHAACGAMPAKEEIVAAILDARPELARGMDRESGNTALHVACQSAKPNLRVIRQLIVAGVAVSTRNTEGYTAFHLAVLNRADALQNKVKEMLLGIGGANVNERTELGQTALHLVAVSDDYFTVVQFLVTHGADLWARAPLDVFLANPYGYKGKERIVKTVTPPEAASIKGAIRNGRYFDRSIMNSRLVF